nr:hypothetical protein [Paracoccus saliphilus]
MFGRLQKGLGRHAIIRKPRFFGKLKITLDELWCRASDLAPCARALEDMVAGITQLLWRTPSATPSIWSHEAIRYVKGDAYTACFKDMLNLADQQDGCRSAAALPRVAAGP